MSLTTESKGTLYPLEFPWAIDLWEKQQNNHWLPKEVTLGDDIRDWRTKLTPAEKNLVTQIFRFFTKSDEEIQQCYHNHYKNHFKNSCIQMMLTAFENMETVHIMAYSHLLRQLEMPETEFLAFKEYEEMKNKLEWLHSFNPESPMEVAESLIAFSGATEGMALFASFAILLNFPRHNKLKGMGDIIAWSVRDESMHCEGIAKLFHTYVAEQGLDKRILRPKAIKIFRQAVANEDAFIDLAFEMGPVEGLTAQEVKDYIRWIANLRFNQVGFEGKIYEVEHMPLPWLPGMLNAPEFGNFFETRVTDYAKASTAGEWEDAYEF